MRWRNRQLKAAQRKKVALQANDMDLYFGTAKESTQTMWEYFSAAPRGVKDNPQSMFYQSRVLGDLH
jgi:hypothetical protein